ncbi:MAG: hypothetical protein IJ313_01750 [Clostridia bacterium]|nr:hypothetical protein [Clostridia bacterium]
MELVHVVSFTLSHAQSISGALAQLRHLSARSQALRCPILLFCDLPNAACPLSPEEEPLIRRLLSGVMSMNARRENCFYLLVRRRVWDDAARQYLGSEQPLSVREVIAQLLANGQTQAVFEAASISPASLKGRWEAALFSDISLACTPDVPARMAEYLKSCPQGAVGARVLPRREYPHSALARLCACSPFSLSPLRDAREYALARQGFVSTESPVLYTTQALSEHASAQAVPAASGCVFVSRRPPVFPEIIRAYRRLCRTHPLRDAYVPLVQLALLAAAAFSGFSPLVAAALLPELFALMRPRMWPGALLRTALLPLTALLSLDTLLCRLLARSPLLRLRVPQSLLSPFGCLLAAGALLPLSFFSVHALAALLPILLLWLSAPLLLPALDRPTIERIPLDGDQQAQLRTLAESAYFGAAKDSSAAPALRMLTACAGCMLGLLEPDEAARQVQSAAPPACASPHEQAAVLVCAQYLRECMRDCDAALRPLPAQLEALILSAPEPACASALGTLLHAARAEQQPDFVQAADAPLLEQLFLPLRSAAQTPQDSLSLPLTHPHTFLRHQLLSGENASAQLSPVERFLFLAAAALGHPFYALLQRSPVAGPYATMFAI